MRTRIILLLLMTTAVSCTPIAPAPTPYPTVNPQQHIIFHNGTILAMDAANSQATALAIKGEKIVGIGNDAEILAAKTANTIVIDVDGRTLMPGFVDAHTHLFNDAEQSFDMSLPEVQQIALENGITTVGDMYVVEDFLQEMREFDADGQLRIRTSLYLVANDNCGEPFDNWWQHYPATTMPGEMLRIGGVKIFTDGGTCGRPALSYELRPGEGLGDLFFSQEELDMLVTAVHDSGHQVAIHAIGDRAVEQAQNSIATALNGQPNTPRHRIEHNSVIRPDLLPRYGELGIVPIVFGPYPLCNPFGPPPPTKYQAWEWPYRALIDSNPGLPIAWHGDDPFFGRIRPLDDLYSLITRNEVGEDGQICAGQAWQQQHLVTTQEALEMMTVNAAYALKRENEVGSLIPGKYADLIILTANPLATNPSAVLEMDVLLTMVGGRAEFCKPGQELLCP